ncbi:MAG: potassium transporter TrkG [Pseudomonadota bacterium]
MNKTGASRPGDTILAERARPAIVLHLLCVNGIALVALGFVPVVVAAVEGAWPMAKALLPGLLISSAMAWYALRKPLPSNIRKVEGLVSVAASFLVATLFVTPGFLALGLAPVDALFEAASAFTTTGLSTVASTDAWPYAGHLLRAWVQWVGGFAFLAAALSLVVGKGLLARRLGAAEGISEGIAASTQTRARQLLAAYIVVTAVAIALLALIAERPEIGLLIALSGVSTGGFAPMADSLASTGAAMQVASALACLLGATSLGLLWQAARGNVNALRTDPELKALLLIIAGAAALLMLIERDAGGALFTVVSAATTAGYSTVSVADYSVSGQLIVIVVMMVGGCTGSTAGGLKVFRVLFLGAAMRLTLLRTRTPSSAETYLRLFGRKTDAAEGTDILGLVVIYVVTAVIVWGILLSSGAGPLPALFETISALSTVGLSAGVTAEELATGAKLALTAAMLLGRLEFLAMIALLSYGTWRKA